MKKVLLLTVFALMTVAVFSQVILEQSFNYSATVTKINDNSFKYFLMDIPGKQCRIYNPDFSPYKTINLSIPEGEWLYDIRFVTENLFNEDSKIELLYTYYKWITVNVNSGEGYYVYHSRIINEDGSLILDIPGGLYSYVHETSPGEYSLFMYIYDLSVDPYTIKTNIYSLPGTTDEINYKSDPLTYLSAYPNPASTAVEITFTLPDGKTHANLHLLDANGIENSVYRVEGNSGRILINASDLLPGIYFYHLEDGSFRSEARKIIITK